MVRSLCVALLLIVLGAQGVRAQEVVNIPWDSEELALHVPQHILNLFWNPDGSCVQCSNSMIGTDQHVMEFAYLLWDSEYGKKVRGGSGPDRVEGYARARGVRVWNITGKDTWEWMKWACRNGRGAAIGAGSYHFQTLVGHNPAKNHWYVVNNNGNQAIQRYDEAAFRKLHLASGQWCVILDYPPAAAPPQLIEWWNQP